VTSARSLDVLYSDNHVLAIAKPAGVPCVPDPSGDESLLDRAREWVRETHAKPGNVYLGVVHRLDRPVSGVVVFARTSKAAARLSAQFREGDSEKVYWGICSGRPLDLEGRVEHWLAKRADRNLVAAHPHPVSGGKHARTRWRVLGPALGGAGTWVELTPETGRPHQLRVAMASLGCPLLGDVKYGAEQRLADRSIALHARRLVLAHPTRPEPIALECAPPAREWWAVAR
jgi:23S rRNA pseudouridine1911/1915/1917 synthase